MIAKSVHLQKLFVISPTVQKQQQDEFGLWAVVSQDGIPRPAAFPTWELVKNKNPSKISESESLEGGAPPSVFLKALLVIPSRLKFENHC